MATYKNWHNFLCSIKFSNPEYHVQYSWCSCKQNVLLRKSTRQTNKQIVLLFHFVHRKCVCSHTCILCRQGRLHRFLVYNHCLVAVHTNKIDSCMIFNIWRLLLLISTMLRFIWNRDTLHYRTNECKEIKAYFSTNEWKRQDKFLRECCLIDLSWLR